jgi:hypothetical protein
LVFDFFGFGADEEADCFVSVASALDEEKKNSGIYLPEKHEIYENNYLKNIIDKYTGTNIGSYIFRPLYPCASPPVDNKMVEAVEIVEKINPI